MAFTQLEFENCPQLSEPRSKARAKAREADWRLIELKLGFYEVALALVFRARSCA